MLILTSLILKTGKRLLTLSGLVTLVGVDGMRPWRTCLLPVEEGLGEPVEWVWAGERTFWV